MTNKHSLLDASAMQAPIPRERLHRISDIDAGFAPRDQAALEDAHDRAAHAFYDTPPVTAEDTVTTCEKVIFVAGCLALLLFLYGATTLLLPILVAVGSGM